MDIDELINKIRDIIRESLPDEQKWQVLLFGSQAQGTAEYNSDVDVAIQGNTKVPSEAMTNILWQVEELPTLRKVDIVDLQVAKEGFKKEVLASSKVI